MSCSALKEVMEAAREAGMPETVVEQFPSLSSTQIEQDAFTEYPEAAQQACLWLAENGSEHTRCIIAGVQSASTEVLNHLARDREAFVRWSVAENPSTPPNTLSQLAADNAYVVRVDAAFNPSTPKSTLARLARDGTYVRAATTRNPSTPAEAFAHLAQDADEHVRMCVAGSSFTPEHVLSYLAEEDSSEHVRRLAMENFHNRTS